MNSILVQFVHWCRRKFATNVDGASLGFFRIVWGGLMIVEVSRKLEKATGLYSADYFHFKYSLTPFVEPLPENWMVFAEIWLLIISAAMVMLGLGFRFFAAVFFLFYTHLFLIEKMYFNNHFYLTSLLAFLLILTSADQCFSVKSWLQRKKKQSNSSITVPFWNLIVLRAQIVIVYFFGGVSKLQGDWLQGEPLRHWFGNKPADQIKAPLIWFPEIIRQEWFVWMLSYGGMIFDFAIGFFLLNRKTFWPAATLVILFHVTNYSLFKIGLFPIIGVSLLALFFQPHWPRPILGKRFQKTPIQNDGFIAKNASRLATPAVTAFVLVYIAVQALLPFRTLKYEGDPSWSEVGHYYSWRMMLRDKDAYLKFFFNPPEAERILEVSDQKPKIAKSHVQKMVKNPQMILSYTHALDRSFKEMGIDGVEIRVASIVSLNGRPYQLMIDPEVDLAKASYGFFDVPDWIIPLEKNLRPGLYPKSSGDRKAKIEAVFSEKAKPILSKIRRNKFKAPLEELLEKVNPEAAEKYRNEKAKSEAPRLQDTSPAKGKTETSNPAPESSKAR
ncbi:MAG: HTTM domain-containing protein [Verrucomicrobiales bacterium]